MLSGPLIATWQIESCGSKRMRGVHICCNFHVIMHNLALEVVERRHRVNSDGTFHRNISFSIVSFVFFKK